LGPFPHWSYNQDEIDLRQGDRLLLFTDGVTELRGPLADEFGEDRLIELLLDNRHLDADALRDRIVEAVMGFNDGEFQDDATILLLCA
jgi:sigma-B regulation protein RsbU (phosphoserine phosphatase)